MLLDTHVAKGRLQIASDLPSWRRDFLESGLREIPVDGRIAISSADLEDFHADPADRIIVTTALAHAAELSTADTRIPGWEGYLDCHGASRWLSGRPRLSPKRSSLSTATELARKLGDVLGRIRYRGESFVVGRNGEPIARLTPLATGTASTALEGLRAWRETAGDDPSLADDLERVNRADQVPSNPWDSLSTPAR